MHLPSYLTTSPTGNWPQLASASVHPPSSISTPSSPSYHSPRTIMQSWHPVPDGADPDNGHGSWPPGYGLQGQTGQYDNSPQTWNQPLPGQPIHPPSIRIIRTKMAPFWAMVSMESLRLSKATSQARAAYLSIAPRKTRITPASKRCSRTPLGTRGSWTLDRGLAT